MAKGITLVNLHQWWVRLKFDPRDIYFGIRWEKCINACEIRLCLVPMVGLDVRFMWDISLPEGMTVEGDQVFVDGQPILRDPEAEDKQMYWEMLERVFLEAWQDQ